MKVIVVDNLEKIEMRADKIEDMDERAGKNWIVSLQTRQIICIKVCDTVALYNILSSTILLYFGKLNWILMQLFTL